VRLLSQPASSPISVLLQNIGHAKVSIVVGRSAIG
jgi:hypothetical protein